MRNQMLAVGLICAIAATTPAIADDEPMSEEAAERLAEFERTGEKLNCINIRSISQITPLDERYFLVRVGVGRFYLNEVRGRCNNADRGFNRLQYTTSLSRLCRNEIINVVDNNQGFIVGSCGLGSFERLERIPEEEEDSSDI